MPNGQGILARLAGLFQGDLPQSQGGLILRQLLSDPDFQKLYLGLFQGLQNQSVQQPFMLQPFGMGVPPNSFKQWKQLHDTNPAFGTEFPSYGSYISSGILGRLQGIR